MKLNIKKGITYPKIVAFGFFILIAAGTILLLLPISSRQEGSTGLTDALFTATSASCVTGLVVADTYTHWTLFGQIVIICLIQIGGLGFLTILTMFSMLFHRKIGLKERSLLQESVNTMYIGGIVRLIKKNPYRNFYYRIYRSRSACDKIYTENGNRYRNLQQHIYIDIRFLQRRLRSHGTV